MTEIEQKNLDGALQELQEWMLISASHSRTANETNDFATGFSHGVEAMTLMLFHRIVEKSKDDHIGKILTDVLSFCKSYHGASHVLRGRPAECQAFNELEKRIDEFIIAKLLRMILKGVK